MTVEAATVPRTRGVSPNWLLLAVALGVFFAADDQTFVVTVLPSMIKGIGLPQDEFYRAAWIVNGYLLGYTVAMPLMGRVADVFGHARIYILSIFIFMAGSAWVALSPNLEVLIVARSFQAIGGGAVVPVAMAIVADVFPAERRAMGIAAMAAASEAGGLFGPLWGGSLVQAIGWRGLFWINLPMCFPIAVAVYMLARDRARQRVPIDIWGGVFLAIGLTVLTVALTDDPIEPRPLYFTLPLYATAAAAGLAFVLRERLTRVPMVALDVFRSMPVSAGHITNLLVGGGLIVAMASVPLFTNVVLGDSPLMGGLNLMRMTVMLPIGALLGGILSGWLGFHRTTAAGMALCGIGFLLLSTWPADVGQWHMTLPLLVAGLGFGVVIAPIGTAVVNAVGENQRATVSALLQVARLIGMLVGIALLTSRGLGRFYERAAGIALDDPAYKELLTHFEVTTFSDTFIVTALVCFLAILPALMLGRGLARRLSWREIWPLS